MIQKLRRKYILLSIVAICVLLTVLVTGMNVISYRAMVREADSTLELLGQNRGRFPEMKSGKFNLPPMPFSPELPYESRFFSAVIDRNGEISFVDTDKIASVDETTARTYAEKAQGDRGFVEN